MAQCVSSGLAVSWTPRSCEMREHTTCCCSSSSRTAHTLASTTSGASKSARPAASFTISSTGKYVMPSPYGRQRPRSTAARSSSRETNSSTNRDFPTHVGGGADRSEGIVLVHKRDPEHCHHRVADELLDGPSVAFARGLHLVEVARHHPAKCLGIESLAERRGAGDVAEDDRYGLALLVGSGSLG
jgi:hypothetical protein